MRLCLIVFLASLHGALSQWNNNIYVSSNGSDTPSCLDNGSVNNPCQTLQYAASGLADSTRISVMQGSYHLNETIHTSSYSDIAVTGIGPPQDQRIDCAKSVAGAGLYFAKIQNLFVSNLSFEGCGSLLNGTSWNNSADPVVTNLFRSAMYVLNCTDVTVELTLFTNGTGRGLVMFDTNGRVSIINSNFTNNKVPEVERLKYPGGGGMYIEHTYCTPGRTTNCDIHGNPYSNDSHYVIQNCVFRDNEASVVHDVWHQLKGPNIQSFDKAGGMFVLLKGLSANNTISISGCQFHRNIAHFGGGLAMYLQDFASHNILHVSNTLLEGNSAHQGGGGLILGYASVDCDCLTGNEAIITTSIYSSNLAQWGGGLYFYASRASTTAMITNTLNISDSTWVGNYAVTGAAVQLVPEAWDTLTDGYLPEPVFKNCLFHENFLIEQGYGVTQSIVTGILFANTITVKFESFNNFTSNIGTAIYINSGSVEVRNNSILLFEENYGIDGGAMALVGFSALRTFPGANVTFVRNFAAEYGGAIYSSSTDVTDIMYTRSCFFRYSNTTEHPDYWQVSFNFVENSASQYGHSIYAETILPCARAALASNNSEVFHWTPFHYSDPDREYNIATAPAHVSFGLNQSSTTVRFSPGEVFNVHPMGYDNFNNSVKSVYKASVSNSTNIHIDSSYVYISNGKTRITGEIGTTFNLTFRTLNLFPAATSVNLTVDHCPLGFVLYQNGSRSECICSANTVDQQYEGIMECDFVNFTGLLGRSYWAGCTENGEFLTGSCPLGYCRYFKNSQPFIRLNRTCEDLDEYLCGARDRTGLLCGGCTEGHSVLFHSQLFQCGVCTDTDAKVGWFLYVISELVPLVILFVLIMVLQIKLTSGEANSIILFAQVLSFFKVDIFGTYTLPRGVDFLTQVYRFLFGMVNLSFFEFDSLSFCLWKGATVLDVMAFKYVTTTFALLLLLVLVVVLNFFTCNRCCKISRKGTYVIHGISAFLVISYAQCAKISFEILTKLELMGEGPSPKKAVVFLSGNVAFFSREHLPYAIPAILVLLLFCALPPLVLIAYPVVNKIPWKNRLPQVNFVWFRRRIFHMSKLKPLIDSFQGSFKDEYRFFAGLYFLYRLAIAAEFAFTSSPIEFYVCLEVIVIVMLAFTAIAHPYKKRLHNVVDALIFADLAIINALNLYTYFAPSYKSTNEAEKSTSTASAIQLILIYLPLLYIVGLIVVNITPRRWANRIVSLFKNNSRSINYDEDSLPALRSLNPKEEEYEYGAVDQ